MDILADFQAIFNLELLYKIGTFSIPILLAITLHEAGHAYVAYKSGDISVARAGRVSLNPICHIDPMGTILLPMVLALTTGIAFGWAKPVTINLEQIAHSNPGNLSSAIRRIAFAGPLANFVMAFCWMILFKIVTLSMPSSNAFISFIGYMSIAGISINLNLMILNLLPILPLDGGRILVNSLSEDLSQKFSKTEGIGMILIMILAVTQILNKIIDPIVNFIMRLFGMIFSVNI